jgi:hypothetical protein
MRLRCGSGRGIVEFDKVLLVLSGSSIALPEEAREKPSDLG